MSQPCFFWLLLAARAALELQRALAATGQLGVLGLAVPPSLSELHGSFADLVQQLQECVNSRRAQGENC